MAQFISFSLIGFVLAAVAVVRVAPWHRIYRANKLAHERAQGEEQRGDVEAFSQSLAALYNTLNESAMHGSAVERDAASQWPSRPSTAKARQAG